ncbi:hypothetical protein HPB49_008392 [Dermacentor silvarum]|uniref:Uncharacterized protein n=1 Tax=Dermacentor silvarum TaxID=543639 RepID=A0ACB8DB64_DERSI|nr:hypothetical protein HPB49_008392 [Dermacentor silvarum]
MIHQLGTAAQWLCLQPPFLSWDQFVAAFRAEFLSVAYYYRIRRELDARAQDRSMRVCETPLVRSCGCLGSGRLGHSLGNRQSGFPSRSGTFSSQRDISPSSLESTRQREPTYSAPYAAFQKYPGALIKRDLPTGPFSPPLRFAILVLCSRFQAKWRPLLLYSGPYAHTFFERRCLILTVIIRPVRRHLLYLSHKHPWRTSSTSTWIRGPQERRPLCRHDHQLRVAHAPVPRAASLGRSPTSGDQEAVQLTWVLGQ